MFVSDSSRTTLIFTTGTRRHNVVSPLTPRVYKHSVGITNLGQLQLIENTILHSPVGLVVHNVTASVATLIPPCIIHTANLPSSRHPLLQNRKYKERPFHWVPTQTTNVQRREFNVTHLDVIEYEQGLKTG